MARAVLIVVGALLSGCAPILGGAVAGGAIGYLTADAKIADEFLAADKPAKQAICARELPTYHATWFKAWCAHLPDDLAGLAMQWAEVGIAEANEN